MKCILNSLLMFCFLISFNLTAQTKTIKTDTPEIFKLKIGDCYTSNGQNEICFDRILEDSRCPPNVQCVWAGNALLNFDLTLSDDRKHAFQLKTNSPRFQGDTIIENIYILLEGLTQIGKSPNHASLLLVNLKQQKGNAQILGFSEDKGRCNYGWTIKMDNDTIIVHDLRLKREYQKNMDFPIDTYLELGELYYDCLDSVGYDNYRVNRMVKVINRDDKVIEN